MMQALQKVLSYGPPGRAALRTGRGAELVVGDLP